MQLPRHAGGVRRGFLTARLRVDAIGLNVFVQPDIADGEGVRIAVGQMRTVARIRLDENYLGVDFERGAHRFGERIARLHGYVDGAVFVGRIGIKDHRHLRQTRQRLQVDVFERTRQLDRHNSRPFAQNCPPHFHGEFQPAWNYGKIGEITPAQTGRVFNSFWIRAWEHTATPRHRAFREWPCASENARRFGWTA